MVIRKTTHLSLTKESIETAAIESLFLAATLRGIWVTMVTSMSRDGLVVCLAVPTRAKSSYSRAASGLSGFGLLVCQVTV